MSADNPLLAAILQGESKTLEFKVDLPKGDQLVKTLIAFANTSGGKLVIGVNDERELIGLAQVDVFELMDKVSSMIHDLCAPSLLPGIYIENIQNTELLIIEVSRGSLIPYYLKTKGRQKGVYIRLGASNREASPEYIQSLELQRLNQSFDEQISHQQSLDSLDLSPLQTAFAAQNKSLTLEKMRNLKLIIPEQGQDYPSHGLLILLGLYEHVEIKCSRFKGTTMAVFLDKKEYRGDLLNQLQQAELFIKNHLHLKGEILGLQRTDTYEIPLSAIREALVNAIVHRDYSNFGRDIKVGIYDDILNIVSPGALPNGLTVGELHKGRSEIRNRVIARVFRELGYIEQWGSGISRIKQLCLQADNIEPQLQEGADYIDWAFFRPIAKGSEETAKGSEETAKGSEETAKGSEEIKKGSEEITKGSEETAKGSEEIKKGSEEITKGSEEIKKGSEEITKGSEEIKKGSEETAKGSEETVKGSEETVKGSEETVKGSEETAKGSEEITKGSEEITKGSEETVKGSEETVKGSEETVADPEKSSFKTSQRILSLLEKEPKHSAKTLAEQLNVSQRAVEKQLAALKITGQIERRGPTKGGHWLVKKAANQTR